MPTDRFWLGLVLVGAGGVGLGLGLMAGAVMARILRRMMRDDD